MRDVTLLIKPASSLCNMRCRYCFYADVSSHREVRSYGIMSDSTLETLVRRAIAFADRSCTFAFQGGEPTLAGLDFFKKLISLQKKYNGRGIEIFNSIQTNGFNTDKEWAEFFAENNFLVGVSLDGYRELHDRFRVDGKGEGTYERILANIDTFQKVGVEFNILTVVNKYTCEHPEKVYDSLKKYRYLQFIPMIDDFGGGNEFSLTSEDYEKFLKVVFDRYANDALSGNYVSVRDFDDYITILQGHEPTSCTMHGQCGGYFVTEADGSIYPCDFYVTDEWRLGNINESSFFTIAKSDKAWKFVSSSVCKDEKCKKCKWHFLCNGGCRRYREPFPSLSKFCGAYEGLFEHAYEKMQKIARYMSNK